MTSLRDIAQLAQELQSKIEANVLSLGDRLKFAKALEEYIEKLPDQEKKAGIVVLGVRTINIKWESAPKLVLESDEILKVLVKAFSKYDEVMRFVEEWRKKRAEKKKVNFSEGKCKAIIVDPDFEIATELVHPWYEKVLPKVLEKLGIESIHLHHRDAVKDKVWKLLEEDESIAIIEGVGHGNINVFTGFQYSYIFYSCQYPPKLIKGKCFKPISCLVGGGLVPDMVEKGLGCGIGEETEYYLVYTPGTDPLEDPRLSRFMRAEFEFWEAMAEGRATCAYEAWEAMIDKYLDEADEAEKNGQDTTAYWLRFDAAHRKFFGDMDWVPPHIPPPKKRVETVLEVKYTADEEHVDVEKRKLKVYINGVLKEKESGAPVAGAEIKIASRLDDGEEKTFAVTTDGDGEFTATVEYVADWLKHYVSVKVVFEGMETEDKRYLPSDYSIIVEFPPKEFTTQIVILDVEKKLKKWNPWLAVYSVVKKFKVKVKETGETIIPDSSEITVKAYDKTGPHNFTVEVMEDGTVVAYDDVYVPGLRSQDYTVDVEMFFEPERPQIKGCEESEKLEFPRNYTEWWWIAIIIILWIISMLL